MALSDLIMKSTSNWFSLPHVAALFGAVFISSSGAVELVTNGGFEAGSNVILPGAGGVLPGGGSTSWILGTLSGWNIGGNSGQNALATNQEIYFNTADGGPRSGQLAAVFPNTPVFDGYISQPITTTLPGVYKISFYLGNQIGSTTLNSMTVNWGGTFTSSGNPISGGVSLTGNGGNLANVSLPGVIPRSASTWNYYEFSAPTSTATTRLSFIGGDASAALLLDDVSVTLIPEPVAPALIGVGMLVFGLRRNRHDWKVR